MCRIRLSYKAYSMKKIVSLILLFTSLLFGAGYQIPNNSINSYALATANVANANGADTAYYNPANMVYNENQHKIECSLTFVSLSAVNYQSTSGPAYDINSKDQQVLIPSLHPVHIASRKRSLLSKPCSRENGLPFDNN